MNLSVIVISLNEENNIERALKSVLFADEIIVVDSGSLDRTVEIASKYTSRIFYRKLSNFADQLNFALTQCTHDWVMQVNADEEVTPELAREIESALQPASPAGYYVMRRDILNGRELKYGHPAPEIKPRLFRKSAATYEGRLFSYPRVTGELKPLTGKINHFLSGNLGDIKIRVTKLAQTAAREKFATGERHNSVYKYFSGAMMFIKVYLFRLGFLDGSPGLYHALGHAMYNFYRQDALYTLCEEEIMREGSIFTPTSSNNRRK